MVDKNTCVFPVRITGMLVVLSITILCGCAKKAAMAPRDSAIAGTYSFTHADLSTFKGISGVLSSTDRYGGTLARIEVQGETDTPRFQLTVSQHPVPLHTDFHAIVDGTDGDTYLTRCELAFSLPHLPPREK